MQTTNGFLDPNTGANPAASSGSEEPELLTKIQIAQRLQKTTRCVDSWMKRGYLPYFKVGRSVLFRWADVVESLNRYRIG
jgi:hypothetical protein